MSVVCVFRWGLFFFLLFFSVAGERAGPLASFAVPRTLFSPPRVAAFSSTTVQPKSRRAHDTSTGGLRVCVCVRERVSPWFEGRVRWCSSCPPPRAAQKISHPHPHTRVDAVQNLARGVGGVNHGIVAPPRGRLTRPYQAFPEIARRPSCAVGEKRTLARHLRRPLSRRRSLFRAAQPAPPPPPSTTSPPSDRHGAQGRVWQAASGERCRGKRAHTRRPGAHPASARRALPCPPAPRPPLLRPPRPRARRWDTSSRFAGGDAVEAGRWAAGASPPPPGARPRLNVAQEGGGLPHPAVPHPSPPRPGARRRLTRDGSYRRGQAGKRGLRGLAAGGGRERLRRAEKSRERRP